jgi:hypothetical protein
MDHLAGRAGGHYPGGDISRPRPCQVLSNGVQDGPLVLPVVIARGQLGRGETVLWTALSLEQRPALAQDEAMPEPQT